MSAPFRSATAVTDSEQQFQRLKTRIHEELIESIDLSVIGQLDENQFSDQLVPLAEELCRRRGADLTDAEQQRLLGSVLDEVFGLGPLEPLLSDPSITEILVNSPDEVFIERRGRLERTIRDPGACRDLSAGLAEAVQVHVAEVRARVPGAQVIFQKDGQTSQTATSVSPSSSSRHTRAHLATLAEAFDRLTSVGTYPWNRWYPWFEPADFVLLSGNFLFFRQD